ncbi:cell division protein FtsQ/DivIB [Pseudonocardia sp. GCM10023141]|uniref:cell division protein FtsQ/DivIB n=1 Tax=Pseudonocardia sp. GCM10023141 TaxID=3252653 RepID=UPI00360D51DF
MTRPVARPSRTPTAGGRTSERPRSRRPPSSPALRDQQPGRSGPGKRRPTSAQIRRRRIVGLVVVLAVLAGLGIGVRVLLHDAGLFDVKDVTVTGAGTVPVADVLAAAAVTPGGPLLDVDTAGAAQRVAALPAVASVHVDRSWPHTVTVAVIERVPVAVFATDRGDQLVDGGGAVYPGPVPPGLPRLTMTFAGPDDPATHAALTALGDLPPAVRPQVLSIDARADAPGAPSQVSFGLTDDRQVRWGDPDRGKDKAAVLVPLLTRPGRVYDVSSPDLATVRR